MTTLEITNPRYKAYLRDHNKDIEIYILWIENRWKEYFLEKHGKYDRWEIRTEQDHHDFNEWLNQKYINIEDNNNEN